MPITIDGEKISLHAIKETDLYVVHAFLNKVKGKSAIMIYTDSNEEIQIVGIHRTKKAKKQIETIMNKIYSSI